jgi:hypothetical protein
MRSPAAYVYIALAIAAPSASWADSSQLGVGAQYDSTHVYATRDQVDAFANSFIGTFGGTSTRQVVATVTPTPSETSSQLLQTPVGMISLFGFRTPIPYPFGLERTGYLVTDLDAAVAAAREAGAILLVAPFADPIGRDAIVQWPGGVNMQFYWHNSAPHYPPLQSVPENRVYISPDAVDAFIGAFLRMAQGTVVSDHVVSGAEIGRPDASFRRVRIESIFGKLVLLATDGHLPYPYGHETTGYEVADLTATLERARAHGVNVLVNGSSAGAGESAMVEFPGGYVAEIHAAQRP